MPFFHRLLTIVGLCLAICSGTQALAQDQVQTLVQTSAPQGMAQGARKDANHIAAELVATPSAQKDGDWTLALHFTPAPGWHGYWRNPGDAGYGMRLGWTLPEGWSVGEPLYPVPQTLLIAGLMNHVYEGDYAVLIPLNAPAGAAADGQTVSLDAQWLACTDKICVPEEAELSVRLENQDNASRFDAWRAALPPLLDQQAQFSLGPKTLRIAIPLPASLDVPAPYLFLGETQLVDYAGAQIFRRKGDTLVAELPRKGLEQDAEALSGILKLDDAGNGVRFIAQPGTVPSGGIILSGGGEGTDAAGNLAPLWVLLAGALAGGLLLNIMPCVFPILSLKALSLARAGESEAEARREGLAYSAGVILACVMLGVLLLALRAGGTEIGWAFQLQEPGVVVALLALALAITANLAGLYELPSLSLNRAGGRSGAFSTGLLAAFVATPCTGPFMAAAMGAALLLPPAQALLLFAALGLGLALPFLLLGFIPPLRRILPRPGPWMDRFRKILAVPMGLTVLALVWLCLQLGGGAFAALALALAAAFTLLLVIVIRRYQAGRRALPLFIAGLAVLAVIGVIGLPRLEDSSSAEADSLLAVVPFSEDALSAARAEGKPVFLWFTADWCLTCKVNENVAIEREETRKAFEKAGVVAMRGDWTRREPAITRFLTRHGVGGVPLYLWYPADGGEPEVLPQILTPDSLTDRASR
ncbi:protein-disulfide reductase DsbD family protein [Altericroceibacterium endophyticum]|uniref:Thiol:disulfide interchange protein n=1 Tax=Altericroceibacterium endophyticum TaxID=1808508 RepID=A0A6I4T4J4_9SPHN|nr:protein-disulfide reductase DsbD domain-containing protein [Altericroceibacterium endophyticum]MXO64983.1 thiol:disulfide interchange protein [Altericroceibacterium endophyticum]